MLFLVINVLVEIIFNYLMGFFGFRLEFFFDVELGGFVFMFEFLGCVFVLFFIIVVLFNFS